MQQLLVSPSTVHIICSILPLHVVQNLLDLFRSALDLINPSSDADQPSFLFGTGAGMQPTTVWTDLRSHFDYLTAKRFFLEVKKNRLFSSFLLLLVNVLLQTTRVLPFFLPDQEPPLERCSQYVVIVGDYANLIICCSIFLLCRLTLMNPIKQVIYLIPLSHAK